MRIRYIKSFASFGPGNIVDVDPELAAKRIADGFAEAVDAPESPVPSSAPAIVSEPEAAVQPPARPRAVSRPAAK